MSTTIDEAAASPASPARPRAEVLRRADGVELIGEFEDSGYREPPLIARRSDGQVVKLTEMLYAVAEAADGQRDSGEIAAVVSERCGRNVSAGNVAHLADRQLRPLGVLALADGSTPQLEKREALMALRHRKPLLSERAVNRGARLFTWLHLPIVKLALLLLFAGFDAWLFGIHGIAGGLRSAIYNPELLLAVFASVIVATAFHEFGHASACRYGGARPGVMGVGLYVIWPAFYCDVTDAYRLNRTGRLRTDLGGVYFNAIFALLAGVVFFATGEEAALLAAVVQHVIMLQQLLPLLRFDGYYVLTDLTGVPDILERIKPIFRSLVRGRRSEPKVMELKPWVRFVVTAYLVTLVPALLTLFAWMLMAFPRILATVYDSFGLQLDRIGDASGLAEGAVGVLRMLMLILPVAAMSLSLSRTARMAGRALFRWSRGSARRRIAATAVAVAVIGGAGYTWWPNGDYEPIRPGERGTIGEALSAFPEAAGGRPSFTPERELMYGSQPTEREVESDRRALRRGERPTAPQGESATPGETSEPGADDLTTDGDSGSRFGSGFGQWSTDSFGDDSKDPAAGGTTTQPGTTTETAPAPSTTEPAPSTGTTTTEPAPTTTDGTSTTPTETTPSEPAPTTTDSTTTETAPSPTTESTTTAPELTTTETTTTETTTTPTP